VQFICFIVDLKFRTYTSVSDNSEKYSSVLCDVFYVSIKPIKVHIIRACDQFTFFIPS